MAKPKRIIRQRATLLIVGEGATEEAFLQHLRTLYCSDRKGASVTIRNAYGKGPDNVLNVAIREASRAAQFDHVAVLMDTDIPWSQKLKKQAKDNGIHLIGCEPCIEGLFLKLLDKNVPHNSDECKREIRRHLLDNLTERASYVSWCTRATLDDAKHLVNLQRLLMLFNGRLPTDR